MSDKEVSGMTATERYEHVRAVQAKSQGIKATPHEWRVAERAAKEPTVKTVPAEAPKRNPFFGRR